jgi:hypothetical protein
MTTETDKPVDYASMWAAVFLAQDAFKQLAPPANLDEAKAAFGAAMVWRQSLYTGLVNVAPEPMKLEAHNAMMAVREILNRFQDEAAEARAAGYEKDDLAALGSQVMEILLDAPAKTLFLHNDYLPAHLCAARMFRHFATTGEMYRRGSAVVELKKGSMEVLTSTGFRSRLNKRGRRVVAIKKAQTDAGELFAAPKHCGDDVAKVLLATTEVNVLPEIKLVAAMPLLVEDAAGRLVTTKPGYNADCGVLVTGTAEVREIPIEEAAPRLSHLLCDFKFTADGDRSRALAGLIAPALRMGGLLPGNALIDAVEADDSQAGKGYRHKLTHAIYGETPYPVTQKEGGVGSLDESFAAAVMSGKPFIALDNLRGNLNSTLLEATVTPISNDGHVAVRLPHRGEVMVDASRTLTQLTSNGFSSTRDLANRLLITRLLKQPPGYTFAAWEGGSLLEHAKQFAAYYLSCVHAVVRYWHAHGKPRLATPHTFKDWVGSLDWIVQSVWGEKPLLTGHGEATERLANKGLSWLRQVAHAVVREGHANAVLGLKASDLREICERAGIPIEGVKPGHEDNQAERAIGVIMASCFREKDWTEIDGIRVTRFERDERREDKRDWRPAKFYTFSKP